MNNLETMCNVISAVSFLDNVVNDVSSGMYAGKDMVKQMIVKSRALKKNVCHQALLLNLDLLKDSVLDFSNFAKLTNVCKFLDQVIGDFNNSKFIEKQQLNQVILKNRALKKMLCTLVCEQSVSAYSSVSVPPTPHNACCIDEPFEAVKNNPVESDSKCVKSESLDCVNCDSTQADSCCKKTSCSQVDCEDELEETDED